MTSPAGLPELAVSVGLWQNRPADEVLVTAAAAEDLGFAELWLGEMATFDAFALGAVVAGRTTRIPLTIGPLAVAVRDPAMIAMGVATLTELTGRGVRVALGSSSPVVVQRWHGREQRRTALALAESAGAVRTLLDGGRADVDGEVVSTHGYRLRTAPPRSELTVAAFGPGAVRVAARFADRMVLNLVTPAAAGLLVDQLRTEAAAVGRPMPRVAAWVATAVDPSTAAAEQLRRGLVGYLAAPGYGEMFAAAGFADLVAHARTGPPPRELLAAIPAEAVAAVCAVGDAATVLARLGEYRLAGVDEVALVPPSVAEDPGGVATLAALAAATGGP
jgi:probable F420-dependent oxidoreductase